MNFTPPNYTTAPRDVLSVTSLNRMARSLLESHFATVVVEGEISNLSTPGSGHWYFTLKDSGSQIRCAMFRNRNMGVRFRPRDGMQIVVRGRLSIYEGRGDYQLIADGLEEAGAGALRRQFEELKQRLENEGLFAQERKRQMPTHIRHIAVITSATGAVIRDIVSVLGRRFPATTITLLPVVVQGADAPAAIVKAISIANRRAAALGFDVVIVGRGGGSLEDLQAFNEESVARAIFESALPVVSAVGHESDYSIADFVADLRAPTPSAAAEVLSPDQEEMLQTFVGFEQLLHRLIKDQLQRSSQQLVWLLKQLKHPGRRLQEHAQTLDILEGRLLRATKLRLYTASNDTEALNRRLRGQSPSVVIQQQSEKLKTTLHRLQRGVKQRFAQQQAQLAQLARSLESVSPLNTLNRGYSISFDAKDHVVRSVQSVKVGDTLKTQLADGGIESVVTAFHASTHTTVESK